MAETLSLWSVISFAIAGISLGIAVFFWFFFKIPSVIGGLTGRTARKSIEKMREANGAVAGQTELLVCDEDDFADTEGTAVLSEEQATEPLGTNAQPAMRKKAEKKIVMLEEIMLIHTDEILF